MSEVQLRPLLLALAASLLCLFALVIVWPRFFPPPPGPFIEALLSEIRAQNYDVVYSHLARRWQRPTELRSYLAQQLRDEELVMNLGGFVESTAVAAARVEVKGEEAWVPVSYRLKCVAPPRVWEREVLVKLVYERAHWRLDDIRVPR